MFITTRAVSNNLNLIPMVRSLLLLFSLALLSSPLLRSQVRQVDLKEMIESSGMIFAGVVTEVEGGEDENGDIVTWTTFRVESPIRGVIPGSVKIKQYGGITSKGTMTLAHMRYFVEGERVLVMLYPASDLGFTSPIGMGQGVWSVNDRGELQGVSPQLFSNIEEVAKKEEALPDSRGHVLLSKMISLIQTLTQSGGGNQ